MTIIMTLAVWREAGMWVGQATDFDIGAQANTLEELVRRFEIAAGIELWLANGHQYKLPPKPSGQYYRGNRDMQIRVDVTPVEPPPD